MILREISQRAERLTQEGKLQWIRNGLTFEAHLGKNNPTMVLVSVNDVVTFSVLGPSGDLRGLSCKDQDTLKKLYSEVSEQVELREEIKKSEQDKSYLRFTLEVLKTLTKETGVL